jgi:hypothetical protein
MKTLHKFSGFRKDTARAKEAALLVVMLDADLPRRSLGIRPCRRYGTQ